MDDLCSFAACLPKRRFALGSRVGFLVLGISQQFVVFGSGADLRKYSNDRQMKTPGYSMYYSF